MQNGLLLHPTAVWPLPVTVALLTAARPATKHRFPKGRYVRSQHIKSAPNGITSALNNLSAPSVASVVGPLPVTATFPTAVALPLVT